MSGIGGCIDYASNTYEAEAQLQKMSYALTKRGGGSTHFYKSERCSLMSGGEPLTRGQGETKYILVFSGNLFNAQEIRTKLIKLGYEFKKDNSDEEVVLNAYLAWNLECLAEFNGVFAFAVWNDTKKSLFLARDRIGVQPMFFHRYDGGLIFGSEIKTVLAHDKVPNEINAEGIASLVLLGPAKKCGSAVFKDVKELEPGCFAEISADGFETHRYWQIKAKAHQENFEETSQHIRELIIDSTERRLSDNVPICTLLSGGLDSSILTVIAANKLREQGRTLSTYSVDYKDNNRNFISSSFQPEQDTPYIEEMAQFVKSTHKNSVIDTPQLANALYDAVDARDLPGMADVDSSLYLFVKLLRKDYSAGLSGECADELFGGYPWYHNNDVLFSEGFPWSRSTEQRADLLRNGIIDIADPVGYVNDICLDTVKTTDYLGSDTPKERRIREMFMLNFYWFMQTLVDRGDRMAAANGFDLRVPFCDYRIVEYAYNIPWEMRAYNGREKGLLRHAFQDMLPNGVAWRKKSPYPKTHNPAYLNLVITLTENIIADSECRISEIFDIDKIKKLISSKGASFEKNWYGQLMQSPQLFAYLIQTEYWLKKYNVKIIK